MFCRVLFMFGAFKMLIKRKLDEIEQRIDLSPNEHCKKVLFIVVFNNSFAV